MLLFYWILLKVNLLCGGTHFGHVAIWDERSPSAPSQLTGNNVFFSSGVSVTFTPNDPAASQRPCELYQDGWSKHSGFPRMSHHFSVIGPLSNYPWVINSNPKYYTMGAKKRLMWGEKCILFFHKVFVTDFIERPGCLLILQYIDELYLF